LTQDLAVHKFDEQTGKQTLPGVQYSTVLSTLAAALQRALLLCYIEKHSKPHHAFVPRRLQTAFTPKLGGTRCMIHTGSCSIMPDN
jgi:hypothetical protein